MPKKQKKKSPIIPDNDGLLDENDEQAYKKLAVSGNTLYCYTADGASVSLENFYRGRQIFLLLSGPSLATIDWRPFSQRGVMTMGVNNSWSVYKPNLWTCVDDPGNFLDVGWKDASILKFAPMGHAFRYLQVKEGDGSFRASQFRVGEMPAVFFFKRNEKFEASTFLTEPTVNWGNADKHVDAYGHKGGRSVMLAAIKILYYLGFRRVYLLGADFKMEAGKDNYAFKQDRSDKSVKGNNGTYAALNSRFAALIPHFKEKKLEVFNCTPQSGLTSFPYMPIEKAIEKAARECGKVIDTSGWYDRKERLEKEEKTVDEGKAATTVHEEVEEESDFE